MSCCYDNIRNQAIEALGLSIDDPELVEEKISHKFKSLEEYADFTYQTCFGDQSDVDVCDSVWDFPEYDDVRRQQEEKDEFVIRPFQIEEGIFTCFCGSKKTYSYTKQVRSADEGSSIFITCAACNKKWREN